MTFGARRIAIALIAAVAFAATAEGARAQVAHGPLNVAPDAFSSLNSVADQSRWSPQQSQKSLFWDQKGHWGLKLDLSQPVGRDMQLRDVQAGAYFHITPSLRVGGAVALGDSEAFDRTAPAPQQQQNQAPRVKLETTFKF
jgi:hypothetical protein